MAQLIFGLALLLRLVSALPSTNDYVKSYCQQYSKEFQPLLTSSLKPYESGITGEQLAKASQHVPYHQLEQRWEADSLGRASSLVHIKNGVLHVDKAVHAIYHSHMGGDLRSLAVYFLPVLEQLAKAVILPDTTLLFNFADEPTDEGLHGGPTLGFCNSPAVSTNIMVPASFVPLLEQHAKPGHGDTRIGKAVFLGGPNGWARGARRTMLRAARLFPELFHVDLYSIPQNDLQLHPDHNLTILGLPRLSLQEQTDQFKYVIYAPGHCASTRLRQELSSASAVFMVSTYEMEWYHPLLIPYRHYIPITLDATRFDHLGGSDAMLKVMWAEANPDEVARIVANANRLATEFLNDQAQLCYWLMLINQYARLFTEPRPDTEFFKKHGIDLVRLWPK